ncbi:MAG TPA: DUF3301 domain-containing protein [Rhodanobacteraceae bacterium]|nr:DUF3301 domain-containing protein [Rhodanobacteraceae bacterium]
MLEVWLPLLSIGLIAAWWYHALRLREHAVAHARELCQRHGLQLLDDSVALHRLHASWRHGGLRITREYRFDTSLGGNDRRAASIILLGDHIVSASVPERDAPLSAPTPAVRVVHDATPTQTGTDAGNNIVPITRARRTLH